MDELWQRYRTFWTPVLWGVGVFLAGLIAVHALTDDPDTGRSANDAIASRIRKRIAPKPKDSAALEEARDVLSARVEKWAKLLDQRHADDPDIAKAAVQQMLRAAIARGKVPADPADFDGDDAAARAATTLYEARLAERLEQLRTQDPNVSFSRLQADVVQELALRANRADVDVGADDFGLGTVTSVSRSELPRRLLNLALIATVVDVAIREGVRSVDRVTIENPHSKTYSQGTDPFLLEWPVTVVLTGPPDALAGVLNVLTDPARPTVLGDVSWTGRKDGLVVAELPVTSLRVRADAPLGLESEGGE